MKKEVIKFAFASAYFGAAIHRAKQEQERIKIDPTVMNSTIIFITIATAPMHPVIGTIGGALVGGVSGFAYGVISAYNILMGKELVPKDIYYVHEYPPICNGSSIPTKYYGEQEHYKFKQEEEPYKPKLLKFKQDEEHYKYTHKDPPSRAE